MDGGVGINVMTIPTMRYLGLKIDRPALVTLKMANKRVVRPKGVISNVVITVRGFLPLWISMWYYRKMGLIQ